MQFTTMKRLQQLAGLAVLTSLTATGHAEPRNGTIVLGSGGIAQADGATNIIQQTDRLAIDWESFNIEEGHSVNFDQRRGAGAIALNRDFSGNVSRIFGELNANGQVFLLNNAGGLIGSSGTINTGGLLISDRNLSLGGVSMSPPATTTALPRSTTRASSTPLQ